MLAVAGVEGKTEGETTSLVGLAGNDGEGREGLEWKSRVGGWAGVNEGGGESVDRSRIEGLLCSN